MEGQAVEIPRPVGEFLDAGKLAGGVCGMAGRVGEVVRWRREVQREGPLGRRQFFGSEESLQE